MNAKHYAQILTEDFTSTFAFEQGVITQEQSNALAALLAEALPDFKPSIVCVEAVGFERLGWDQVRLVRIVEDDRYSSRASVIVQWDENGAPSLVELEGKKIWWNCDLLTPARVEQLQRSLGYLAA